MNVDHILETMNRHEVRYILIGGMNFLLRHKPVTTFDVDLWIDSAPDNLRRCEQALSALQASWGRTEQEWAPVSQRCAGWLDTQAVYCMDSPHGAIDIFLSVRGLDDWSACRTRAYAGHIGCGISYHGLSDADMITCQLALDPKARKLDRISAIREAMLNSGDQP